MSKVKELFDSEKSVYCFDVDGVLVPMEFGEYNHVHFTDEEWAYEVEKRDMYEGMRVNKTIQNFLKDKDMSRVYVITKAFNETELEQKKRFAFKNYNIPLDNVYMFSSNLEKLDIMKSIHERYNSLEDKYMIMIDDTVSVLDNIHENSNYSTVHVSSFFE